MIIVDDKPRTETPTPETPPMTVEKGGGGSKGESTKSGNSNAIIWGIVIVILLVTIGVIINLYNKQNNVSASTGS